MKRNTFVIDLDRCINCKGCMVACKMENGVALGSSRNKILTVGPIGEYPDLDFYYLPLMCQQCESPACIRACPTGASHKRIEDGLVEIDKNICIGCQSCRKACPYGVHTFNKELRVMDKCSACIHLLEKGEKPACVKSCSGRALIFGDINDPDSDVSKALSDVDEKYIYAFQDEKGVIPTVRYILRSAEWKGLQEE